MSPNIVKKVHFLQFQPGAAILMNASDAVALASHKQGTLFVILTASSCAKPGAAYRTFRAEEMIGKRKTGILVDESEVSGVSKSIATPLRKADLTTETGIRAGKAVKKTFSSARFTEPVAVVDDSSCF